jgi:hypothetical protein
MDSRRARRIGGVAVGVVAVLGYALLCGMLLIR